MRTLVAIVEDDPELRDLLKRGLEREEFEARTHADASEAMTASAADAPDAVIIDTGLPDADGCDLCQALRAQGIAAPVVFLTARAALSDRLRMSVMIDTLVIAAEADRNLSDARIVARQAADVVAAKAAERGVKLDLDPGPGPLAVVAERDYAVQVLLPVVSIPMGPRRWRRRRPEHSPGGPWAHRPFPVAANCQASGKALLSGPFRVPGSGPSGSPGAAVGEAVQVSSP